MVLEVESGPRKGSRIELKPGDVLEIGRRGRDLAITEDLAMSSQHFLVSCGVDGRTVLRDLNSVNGTILNSRKVGEAQLNDGDQIEAGGTTFRVRAEPSADNGPPSELVGDPLTILRAEKEQLYAILDAARAPRVLELLRDSDEEYQCLYDGPSAATFTEHAPYLVRLAPDAELLEDLAAEGWGKAWGVYLTSSRPFAEVRKHLRQFLMVEMEGKVVYFRFYDPRVLRAYLPTCNGEETERFFGPISTFLVEADKPETVFRIVSPVVGTVCNPGRTSGPGTRQC